MGNETAEAVPMMSKYGVGNLQIVETAECVTIRFDPRIVIGNFKPNKVEIDRATEAKEEPIGNLKVCSTGIFRPLDTGVRVMLHVIGRDG